MTQDTITPTPVNAMSPQVGESAPAYEDYWGVDQTFRFELPDGKQYFEIRPLDEGGKTRFQKMTNKGIRMNQLTQDAHFDVDPADERHQLIMESVVSWNIMQRDPATGQFSALPCPDNESMRKRVLREQILTKFNPKFVQELEMFIRKNNPWMQDEMTVENIDQEIDRLTELRKQVAEREAGEAASANK